MCYSIRYPKSLVPSINYKQQLDLTPWSDELLLVRRSEKEFNKTFNEAGKLRADAFADGEIPSMSMNILGSDFKLEHIKYRQKGMASMNWDGQKVNLLDYIHDIEIKENSIPILFFYKDLMAIKFPYKKPREFASKKLVDIFYSKIDEEQKKEISSKGKKAEILGDGYSLVEHKPTNTNYWHAELNFFEGDSEKLPRNKVMNAKWASSIIPHVRNEYLVVIAKSKHSHSNKEIISQIDYFKAPEH